MRHSAYPPHDPEIGFPTAICRTVAMTDAGLVWGDASVLVRMSKAGQGPPRLCLDADRDRVATLMSVVGDRPMASDALEHIEAADRFWQRGDKALANLRLIFADLPRLNTLTDAYRLTLAAHVLDEGMAPGALAKALGLGLATEALKYAPGQAHVPAGHGDQSGQFASGRETASAPDARIILATEDDGPANDHEGLQHLGESVPTPSKDPNHFRHPSVIPSPPPVPLVPLVGGGGESDPAPERQPAHNHPPLLQQGPPPPSSQPLPPGIGPGKNANGWVPAVPGKRPDTPRQRAINQAGENDGCHVCGTKDPGTTSGNYIGDHQDPKALNPPGRAQYFLPMCRKCSDSQGGRIKKFKYYPDKGAK